MSILVATPCFDGTVRSEYLIALMQSRERTEFSLFLVPGIHFTDTARDVAVAKFLSSKHSHLMFIDSDLGWEPDAIQRLLDHDKDIVGGAYPIKADQELYPVFTQDASQDKLVKAHGLPGGFMLIKRKVIESLSGIVPHYSHAVNGGFIDVPAVFSRALIDGRMISEDLMFCRRALSAGFEVWLDRDISFTHTGSKSWYGNLYRSISCPTS